MNDTGMNVGLPDCSTDLAAINAGESATLPKTYVDHFR